MERQSVEVLKRQIWPELMKNRKFFRGQKNEDVDMTMTEWIQQWSSVNMPLTGLLKQARICHEWLNT